MKEEEENCAQNCELATNALKSIYQSAYFAANLLLITDGRPYIILYGFHFVLSFLSAADVDADAVAVAALISVTNVTHYILYIGCGNIVLFFICSRYTEYMLHVFFHVWGFFMEKQITTC